MLNVLLGVCLAYVIALFAVAFWAERASMQGRATWLRSPMIYYAFLVYLLYGLDVLWRGWIRGPVWVGICHNLPWTQPCFAGLVVDFTKIGAHWSRAACHIDS